MQRAKHVVRRLEGTVWLGWCPETGKERFFQVDDVDLIRERIGTCRDIGLCEEVVVREVAMLGSDGKIVRRPFTTPIGVIVFAMPI